MESNHPTPSPTPETTPTPVAVAHPAPTVAPSTATGSKALAITALVLAIVSVVIGLAWFIAAPLAIVAIILSIVALAKHANGKGQSIAALIVSGISLIFFVPFWALFSLGLLIGIQQAAEEYRVDAEYQSEQQTEGNSELFN